MKGRARISSVATAFLLAAAVDYGGDRVFVAQAACFGAWLAAVAVITWRRTPIRGVPALQVTFAIALVWASSRVSWVGEVIEVDPWQLMWLLPVLVAAGLAVSAAHRYDASRHPGAHAIYRQAVQEASWLDQLTFRDIPRIEIDPFSDPRSPSRYRLVARR